MKHVKQICADSCVSACMSMILNIPIEKIWQSFHEEYLNGDALPEDFMTDNGMPYRPCLTGERMPADGKHYMAVAPSLNIEGGMHCVVLEYAGEPGMFNVLDPNDGRAGAKTYTTWTPPEPGQSVLKSFCLFLEFDPADVAAHYVTPTDTGRGTDTE